MDKELIKKRLSRARRIGNLISLLPFVRCVILNGSLAQGRSKESSDIDILIIAKNGRIFIARFFVNAFSSILGIKRSKDDSKSHAGKFCFNYFLTEDYLKIPVGRGEKIDEYCAQNYSASKFVAGDRGLFEKFLRANKELFIKYGCEITKSKLQISNPPTGHVCRQAGEAGKNPNYKFKNNRIPLKCHPELARPERGRRVSGSYCNLKRSRNKFTRFQIKSGMTAHAGDWFEKIAKKYQIKKIESDPRTKKYPNLIVYDNRELRFHPPKQS